MAKSAKVTTAAVNAANAATLSATDQKVADAVAAAAIASQKPVSKAVKEVEAAIAKADKAKASQAQQAFTVGAANPKMSDAARKDAYRQMVEGGLNTSTASRFAKVAYAASHGFLTAKQVNTPAKNGAMPGLVGLCDRLAQRGEAAATGRGGNGGRRRKSETKDAPADATGDTPKAQGKHSGVTVYAKQTPKAAFVALCNGNEADACALALVHGSGKAWGLLVKRAHELAEPIRAAADAKAAAAADRPARKAGKLKLPAA